MGGNQTVLERLRCALGTANLEVDAYVCQGCGAGHDVQYHVCPDCGGFCVDPAIDVRGS